MATMSDCVILSDSIMKYVEGIAATHVIAFRGATIEDLQTLVLESDGRFDGRLSDLEDARVILVHVGTNDLEEKVSVPTIMRRFQHLIATIQVRYPRAQVVISTILPRMKDLEETRDHIKMVNKSLRDFEETHGVRVIPTFKRLLHCNEPITERFACCGVHPSRIGTKILKDYLADQMSQF